MSAPAADRPEPLIERIAGRLGVLYGDRTQEALAGLLALVDAWRPRMARLAPLPRPAFDERDVFLIAYPDHVTRAGEAPLRTLGGFVRERLGPAVSAVHVLPFHPSTSYEGYAITDYRAVDPRLGGWEDLAGIAKCSGLMMDLVLNHCSSAHPWFEQYRSDREPGRRFFITVADPGTPWLQRVYRARNDPLLTRVDTPAGPRHVWTTYSSDLVDLDWREPGVLLEMAAVLLDAVARGARVVRLDAFVYVWKEPGTSCLDRPEGHELLRLLQDVLALARAPDTALLPSITNVSQERNAAYLASPGTAREADLVYLLPLSAMLLSALYDGDARALARWLARVPPAPPGAAFFNVAATHDGVGLTWLDGLLDGEARDRLVQGARARGAIYCSRRLTASGAEVPWELDTTYFSACAPEPASGSHVDRFLATQAVLLSLRGVPALYLPSFLAARNDLARVQRTGDPRSINRARFELAGWEERAAVPESVEAQVFTRLVHLAHTRRRCSAFHPEGASRVLDSGAPAVLALLRTSRDGAQRVLCLTNFGAQPASLAGSTMLRAALAPAGARCPLRDLISGARVPDLAARTLGPHETLWLTVDG